MSMMVQSGRFGAAAPTDPNFANVKLLLGFEGMDAATSTTDESPSAHTMNFVGNAQIDTAQFKFGASSLLLDGTGDQVNSADSADWAFGTGNFTVEMFIRPASVTGVQFLICQWGILGSLSWALYLNSAALSWNTSTTGSDNNADLAGGTIVTGSWQHVAVDFDGTKQRLYVGGTTVATTTTTRNFFNSSEVMSIGINSPASSFGYNGWIDEVRITKGVARYASDSGYTVPTAAFPRS